MPDLLEKKIGGREKIEEGRRVFYKAEAGVGSAGFIKSETDVGSAGYSNFLKYRSRRWECRQLKFFKKQKPPLGMPVIEIFLKASVVNADHCHLFPNALV